MAIEILSVVETYENRYKIAQTQDQKAKEKHDLEFLKALQVKVREVDGVYAKLLKMIDECKKAGKGHMDRMETMMKEGPAENLSEIQRTAQLVQSVAETMAKEYSTMFDSLKEWRASSSWVKRIEKASFNLQYLETMQSKSAKYVELQSKTITPEIERIGAYKNRAIAIALAAAKAPKGSKLGGHEYEELAKAFEAAWKSEKKGSPSNVAELIAMALENIKNDLKNGPTIPYSPQVQAALDTPDNYGKTIRGGIKTFKEQLAAIGKLAKLAAKGDLPKWSKLKKEMEEALKKCEVANKHLEEYSKLKPKMIEAYKKFKKK